MSISGDIIATVERLKRADIPLTNLCYLLNEEEWRSLCGYLESVAYYRKGFDLSYAKTLTFYGIEVRKRDTDNSP
jgi:hypothetical protein